MGYVVEILSGPLKGSVYPLESRLIIGREADVDVQVVQKGVSRQHAAVLLDDGGVPHVMDLASKNGTFVDGKSVGRIELGVGGTFRVAETEFVLKEAETHHLESVEADLRQLHLASGPAADATVQEMPVDVEELVRRAKAAKKD